MGLHVTNHSGTIGEMNNPNGSSLFMGGAGKENTGDSINIAT